MGRWFFFEYRKRIVDSFPRVFRQSDDDGVEEGDSDDAGSVTATSELSSNYGWFHVIEELADRDVTKFDKIIDTQASTIFAHLSYKIDYAQFQKQLLTKK